MTVSSVMLLSLRVASALLVMRPASGPGVWIALVVGLLCAGLVLAAQ